MLSESIIQSLNELIKIYPNNRSALLPALNLVQQEMGYISVDSMRDIAVFLDIEPIEVEETMSYYTTFHREPIGKYLIQVCTNISCSLLGAEHLVEYLKQKLGIGINQTTPDKKFTLVTVECLGACDTAPVMMINQEYYHKLTPEKIDAILASLP
ncbi:MAG: NADH-quinone oxidoreductase subunit NuoE [bacterium]